MSGSNQGLVFNVSRMQMLHAPGFVAPRLRIPYTDPSVQDLLASSFEGQLPPLTLTPDGHAAYRWIESGKETCGSSQPFSHISEIPSSEVMRLLQGWIRLRQLLSDREVSEGVRSMLLNLRLPHPGIATVLYRQRPAQDDEMALHILHGFENNDTPTIPIEEAIALMLNIPAQQVAELAGQSQGATPRIATTARSHAKKKRTPLVPIVATTLTATLAVAGWMVLRPTKETPTPPQTSAPPAVPQLPPQQESPPVSAPPPMMPSINSMSVDPPKADTSTPNLEGMIR